MSALTLQGRRELMTRVALEVGARRRMRRVVLGRLPIPHENQQAIIDCPARFRVVACGRRFGKTEGGRYEAVKAVLEGKRGWWLAPTYAMGQDVFRGMVGLLRGIEGVYVNKSERLIRLPNGGMVEVKSTHEPDNLRGAGLDFVVMDEAAFMQPGVWGEVVRPMLLDRKGWALFPSSPNGRNWFWQVYGLGLDPDEAEWASFHFPSSANPLLDGDEIEAIRRQTTERTFREEYLAEFLDDGGTVFRNVDAAARVGVGSREPVAGRRYFFGVDWGRDNDYTVIAVLDADNNEFVHMERFNQIGWGLQRGRLANLFRRWRPVVIWAETNSIGSVNIEELQREGLPVRGFDTTAKSKTPMIEGLALAIERGDVGLLRDEVSLNELKAYTMTRLPGGGFRYEAPSGGHDDTVVAMGIAWHGATVGGGTVIFA